MGNNQPVSEGLSLGRFMERFYREELREEHRHDQQIEVLRFDALRLTRSPRAATRSKALETLKGLVAEIERSGTNASNRRGKPGRKPSSPWTLRCGMDPVDALMTPILLARLGRPLRPAAYDRLLASHAIERAGATLANTRLDVCLKSLRDAPPAKIKKALQERLASLPVTAAGLRSELNEIRRRVFPDEAVAQFKI